MIKRRHFTTSDQKRGAIHHTHQFITHIDAYGHHPLSAYYATPAHRYAIKVSSFDVQIKSDIWAPEPPRTQKCQMSCNRVGVFLIVVQVHYLKFFSNFMNTYSLNSSKYSEKKIWDPYNSVLSLNKLLEPSWQFFGSILQFVKVGRFRTFTAKPIFSKNHTMNSSTILGLGLGLR